MIGIYRIYRNGELLVTQKNLITTFGRAYINRYLAGQVPSIGDYIAVGTVNTPPTLTDTDLYFEFSRGPVLVRSASTVNQNITVKSSIDATVGGIIYEMGLFPTSSNYAAGGYGSKLLVWFDPNNETWSVGSANTTNYRIGTSALSLSATAGSTTTTTYTDFLQDLSGYSNIDQFSLAYFINDANAASIELRLKTDATNYFSYVITPSTIGGYYTNSFTKTNFSIIGSPSWASITQAEVVITGGTGTTVVDIDGLNIIDKDSYVDYGVVSRSVLTTPIMKLPSEIYEVEYTVGLS